MDWIAGLTALIGQWQVLLPVLIVVVVIIWALMRFGVQKPKIASMIKIILETTKGWLSSLLGDKFGPVYNALMAAAEAVVDGALTKDEALATAKTVFTNAIKLTTVKLTTDEQAAVDKVIELVVDAIMHDKTAAKVTIKSL